MKIHPALTLVPLAFALAACGGDTSGGEGAATRTAAARLDACVLLTSEDVASAFGTSFEQGRLEEYGTGSDERYFSTCTFDAANETALPVVSLSVHRAPEVTDPAAALQEQVDETRQEAMPDFVLEPVPELGEGAGWEPNMGELVVFRPGLMITVGGMGAGDLRDRMVGLARTVLERIPAGG